MKARIYTGNPARTIKEGLTSEQRMTAERKQEVRAPRREGRISPLNSKEGTVVFHHQIPHQFNTLALLIKVGN